MPIKLKYRSWILIAASVIIPGLAALYFSFGNVYGHKGNKISDASGNYLTHIASFSDFMSLQGAPLADKHSNVLSVKLLQDANSGRLYFINSGKFRYHYDFSRLVLGDDVSLDIYNAMNYGRALQRSYVLACLNYYEQSGIYTVELSSEDRATAAIIERLMKETLKHVIMHDSVKLLVNSEYLLALDKEGKLHLPKVYPADIYKGQTYQLLNAGVAWGILQNAAALSDTADTRNYILLMKGTPVKVPVCAAIITNTMQAPLSHISVLCHNRNIPTAADVIVYDRAEVKNNMGKPVKMTVDKNGITIAPSTLAAVDSYAKRTGVAKPILLTYNATEQRIQPIKLTGKAWRQVVGNKAAGMGELAMVAAKWTTKFSIPEGAFAIPFYYYQQHLLQPAVHAEIAMLSKMEQQNASKNQIETQLKKIRSAIKKQPVDATLLKKVETRIAANGAWTSYRFRSSSNAEDAAGFSGAGLYESKTGKLNDKEKPIDAAIKKVWASAFNDAAYYERRASNIDERTMMMGVLCHRSFPDEIANGVAITKNIYRKGFPGFTINVQVGEVPVVSPPDSVVCEQIVCMKGNAVDPLNFDVVTEYIATSNLNNNQPVLTKKQITLLYKSLEAVRSHYFFDMENHNEKDIENLGLDIEFKFEKNGKLYLKQVRPYR